jgi:hypothetical protein
VAPLATGYPKGRTCRRNLPEETVTTGVPHWGSAPRGRPRTRRRSREMAVERWDADRMSPAVGRVLRRGRLPVREQTPCSRGVEERNPAEHWGVGR